MRFGSSSRQTALTDGKPSDLAITAIIDSVELMGKMVFEKFGLKDGAQERQKIKQRINTDGKQDLKMETAKAHQTVPGEEK